MLSLTDAKLTGKNATENALVLKWMSFANLEVLPALAKTFLPLVGRAPYNKKQVEEGYAALKPLEAVLETRLLEFTYLVGERLSVADLFTAALLVRGFENLYGAEWRKAHPGVTRWFKTVISSKYLVEFLGKFEFREKPVEFVPPKKEKKEAAPKAAKAPKAEKPKAPAAETEDEPAAAPKPKHPLELLGRLSIPIDEWKRTYSNKETREEAIPWFWDNLNTEEWSLWKVAFKYNDELTLTFMSNNQIGGFFNRLSASTKYMFGCMVVYGENNNNGIIGAFMVRGQDFKPAFDVAPDWESYSYEKLDPTSEADKKFFNNMLAWDEPVEGKEIADGKVFK